jgi:hypothetical protein
MAHSNSSVITGKLQGSLGKELVFRHWEGKTIVAKSPGRRKGKPSASQADNEEKFLLASRYAKAILQDADMAAGYAAAVRPRQSAYSRAMEDFRNPPKVTGIDTRSYSGVAGQAIIIRAKDDFRVTAVYLEIRAADGSLVEKGQAMPMANGLDWSYTSTKEISLLSGTVLKAWAVDPPGNEGVMEVIL